MSLRMGLPHEVGPTAPKDLPNSMFLINLCDFFSVLWGIGVPIIQGHRSPREGKAQKSPNFTPRKGHETT